MSIQKIFMEKLWESVPDVEWRREKIELVEKWEQRMKAPKSEDWDEVQRQRERLGSFKPGGASGEEIVYSYEFFLRALVKKLRLNVVEEATLNVLFRFWQPYQGTNWFRGPYDDVDRALFESKRRKSQTYEQLTQCLSVEPMGQSYEARPKDILKYFKRLRPFLSEGLAHRIAQELTQLFRGEGLDKIARLPEFYVNLNWQNTNPEKEMKSFDNVEDYLRSENAGRYGTIKRTDLLDFSIIKLDEIFDAKRVRRGKDPTIFKLVNIFSGNLPAFQKVEDVSARRRDLKKKPKWKRYFKMREKTFA